MDVIVHTGHNIHTDTSRRRRITDDLESVLQDFGDDLARVEVHLSDLSVGRSTGDDIRCLLEAVRERVEPVTVSHQAATQAEALRGAAHKLEALLSHKRGRDPHGVDAVP